MKSRYFHPAKRLRPHVCLCLSLASAKLRQDLCRLRPLLRLVMPLLSPSGLSAIAKRLRREMFPLRVKSLVTRRQLRFCLCACRPVQKPLARLPVKRLPPRCWFRLDSH